MEHEVIYKITISYRTGLSCHIATAYNIHNGSQEEAFQRLLSFSHSLCMKVSCSLSLAVREELEFPIGAVKIGLG